MRREGRGAGASGGRGVRGVGAVGRSSVVLPEERRSGSGGGAFSMRATSGRPQRREENETRATTIGASLEVRCARDARQPAQRAAVVSAQGVGRRGRPAERRKGGSVRRKGAGAPPTVKISRRAAPPGSEQLVQGFDRGGPGTPPRPGGDAGLRRASARRPSPWPLRRPCIRWVPTSARPADPAGPAHHAHSHPLPPEPRPQPWPGSRLPSPPARVPCL